MLWPLPLQVYAASLAPYALSYFGSSQNFCRVAKHWANVRAGELARQHHPSATGFKLNDTGLVGVCPGIKWLAYAILEALKSLLLLPHLRWPGTHHKCLHDVYQGPDP